MHISRALFFAQLYTYHAGAGVLLGNRRSRDYYIKITDTGSRVTILPFGFWVLLLSLRILDFRTRIALIIPHKNKFIKKKQNLSIIDVFRNCSCLEVLRSGCMPYKGAQYLLLLEV